MKPYRNALLSFLITVMLCGCGSTVSTSDNTASASAGQAEGVSSAEAASLAQEEINRIEEYAVDENTSVSVPTGMNENGEFADYVEIRVLDAYTETGKVTKASFEGIDSGKGFFFDEDGTLLGGYTFVGVTISVTSEKDLNINTKSFYLRGISGEGYFDAECFYHDGDNASDNAKEGGVVSVSAGVTEFTVGFFADEDMMKCESFVLVPMFFQTTDAQNNYIEINF